MKHLIIPVILILGGCSSISYKGVTVYIKQEAGGSAYADSARVPDHQQGSDVLVPALQEIRKAYKLELDAYIDALKECRKALKTNPELDCGEIKQPDRPQIPTGPDLPPPSIEPPEPTDPDEPVTIPQPNASWGGGNLWKPVRDGGGNPVTLTAPQYEQGKVILYGEQGSLDAKIRYRGPTNGERQTYYVENYSASSLPKNLIVQIGGLVFLVPDPTQRYD